MVNQNFEGATGVIGTNGNVTERLLDLFATLLLELRDDAVGHPWDSGEVTNALGLGNEPDGIGGWWLYYRFDDDDQWWSMMIMMLMMMMLM